MPASRKDASIDAFSAAPLCRGVAPHAVQTASASKTGRALESVEPRLMFALHPETSRALELPETSETPEWPLV